MKDEVTIGLICIALIAISIGITALLTAGEKAFEVAIAAVGATNLIGGWLSRGVYDKFNKDLENR